jgi:pimeloyl-ACP methyl ester carboxylesterase
LSGNHAGRCAGDGRAEEPSTPVVADVSGNGPAVLLLHGQPGSAADWARVTTGLENDFLVVAPDRPGYGRTGGPATGFAGNADAAVALLDRLGLDRCIAVGHSWGGGVALSAALRHPQRFRGVVLVSSVGPGAPATWGDRLLATPILGEVFAALTIGATGRLLGIDRVQSLADRRLAGKTHEAIRALTRLTGAGTDSRVWQSFVTEQRSLLRELHLLGPALAALEMPVTILHGSADRVVPPYVAALLTSTIPGATGQVLPGAHHLLPLDRPHEVVEAVRDVNARATG